MSTQTTSCKDFQDPCVPWEKLETLERKEKGEHPELRSCAVRCSQALHVSKLQPIHSRQVHSEVSRVTSHLTHQPENPKAFMGQDGIQKPSMGVHACNLALGKMGKEDQEFKASLDYTTQTNKQKLKTVPAAKLRIF